MCKMVFYTAQYMCQQELESFWGIGEKKIGPSKSLKIMILGFFDATNPYIIIGIKRSFLNQHTINKNKHKLNV